LVAVDSSIKTQIKRDAAPSGCDRFLIVSTAPYCQQRQPPVFSTEENQADKDNIGIVTSCSDHYIETPHNNHISSNPEPAL
jgi:hypothetical protein